MRHWLMCIAVLVSVAAPIASASQEGILLMSEFTISSTGLESSGPVKVSGTQTPQGISELKVEAFGREYIAPPSIVKELRGFFANGIMLSYEAGYITVGGRTVYLVFVKGFTSGIRETKRLMVEETGEFKLLRGGGQ